MLLGNEAPSRDIQDITTKLVSVAEQYSKIIENISFQYNFKGYRLKNKTYELSYSDEGYFHLGYGGRCAYGRFEREMPDSLNPNGRVKQTIQTLKTFEQDSLVIENPDGIIFNVELEKKMLPKEIILTCGFQLILGGIVRYEENGMLVDAMLTDFLQKASVSFEDDKEGASTGKLIKATATIGKYKVDTWFDPALNYALKKVRKETSHITGGAQLIWSETNIVTHEIVNSIHIPKEISIEEKFSSGQVEVSKGEMVQTTSMQDKYEYTLFNVLAENQQNDFKIVGIPDGTPVSVRNALQIQYVWVQGKIEPATNELMLRIARGNHKFIPSVSKPRFWLMLIGLLLIVLGIFLKVREWSNHTKE